MAEERSDTMQNTKTCPKCKGPNVVRVDGNVGPYGTGNNMATGNGLFLSNFVNVNRYICCNCGFTEEWIDKEDLAKVYNSKKAKR